MVARRVIAGDLMLTVVDPARFLGNAALATLLAAGIAVGLPGVDVSMVTITGIAGSQRLRPAQGRDATGQVIVSYEIEGAPSVVSPESILGARGTLKVEINRALARADTNLVVISIDISPPMVRIVTGANRAETTAAGGLALSSESPARWTGAAIPVVACITGVCGLWCLGLAYVLRGRRQRGLQSAASHEDFGGVVSI